MPLTLTKAPADILFQLINEANQTNYRASDFTISTPIQVKPATEPSLTSINIQPISTANIFGSSSLTYNRMDISAILSSQQFQILATTGVNLSDIIDEINSDYGINLTASDFIDMVLPVIDPLNPNVARFVTVAINPNSIMYYGWYNLQLGPRFITNRPTGSILIKKFIFISSLLLADYAKTVISINDDGTLNGSFNFLSNVSNVTTFTADTLIKTNDGNFTLLGTFAFKFINSAGVKTSFNGSSFVFNQSGVVTSVSVPRLFDTNVDIAYVQNDHVPYTYVINQALAAALQSQSYFLSATVGNGILRYSNGVIVDPTYSPGSTNQPSIPYTPSFIRLTDDGKLYTVSNPLTISDPANTTGTANAIRIDRLLSTGQIDVMFTRIYITSSLANANALPVYDLFPILNNGFLLLIQPTYGLDIGSVNPLFNGIPLVNSGVSNAFPVSWNNVVKVLEDSTLDPNFTRPFTDISGSALSMDGVTSLTGSKLTTQNLTTGNHGSVNIKLLASNGTLFTSFNAKLNAVNGFPNIEPVVFDSMANVQVHNGLQHQNPFMVASAINIQTDAIDKKVSFGMIKSLLSNRTYSSPYNAVFRYNADGSPDSILFDLRNTTFVSPSPVISDLKLITTVI